MSWLFFSIATALLWGTAELFYKKGAQPNEKYSHLKICVWVGVVMGAHAIFTLLTQDIGYNPVNLLIYLPVSLFYIISMAFSYFGMRFLEESISELVGYSENVIINLDFADVSAVMKDAGRAHMGVGVASGREKAEQAALAAVASPLLETSINGATGVLVNVTGSEELTLEDVETAAGIVQEAANPNANIIFGATSSPDFQDEMRVTVIATGFEQKPESNDVAPAAAAAPAAKKADVSDIDEIFSIFNR